MHRPRLRVSSRSITRHHLNGRPRARAAFTLTPLAAICAAGAIALAGCGSVTTASNGRILTVGAENEYANVIEQIGGRYVQVSAIESNPNTDPHTFEASPSVAETVAAAKLIVQNGVGYDTFMNKIESASENGSRQVIDVQRLLGLPESTSNPHLWYKPATMPAELPSLTVIQPWGHTRHYLVAQHRRLHVDSTQGRPNGAPLIAGRGGRILSEQRL